MAGGQMTAADWTFAGGTPTAGDKAIVPGTATFNAIDSGALGESIDLGLLLTHPLFGGMFGSQGTPIRTCAGFIHVMNSLGFYFECDGLGSTLTTDLIVVDCKGSATAPVELGSSETDPGDLDKILVVRGATVIKGNAAFNASAKIQLGSTDLLDRGAALKISSGISDALANLLVHSGTSVGESVISALAMCGGIHTQDVAKIVRADLGGGRLIYNHAAVGGEVLSITVQSSAKLDLMGNSKEKVLDQVIALPGSDVLWNPSIHTITDFKDLRNANASDVA